MSNFNDREKAQEKKFVLDAEMDFKVNARRNKLLGLWVAELLGKTGKDAEEYAVEVVISDLEEEGDDDVFRKVKQDLIAVGSELSDVDLRGRMGILMTEAISQIKTEAEG